MKREQGKVRLQRHNPLKFSTSFLSHTSHSYLWSCQDISLANLWTFTHLCQQLLDLFPTLWSPVQGLRAQKTSLFISLSFSPNSQHTGVPFSTNKRNPAQVIDNNREMPIFSVLHVCKIYINVIKIYIFIFM